MPAASPRQNVISPDHSDIVSVGIFSFFLSTTSWSINDSSLLSPPHSHLCASYSVILFYLPMFVWSFLNYVDFSAWYVTGFPKFCKRLVQSSRGGCLSIVWTTSKFPCWHLISFYFSTNPGKQAAIVFSSIRNEADSPLLRFWFGKRFLHFHVVFGYFSVDAWWYDLWTVNLVSIRFALSPWSVTCA